MATFICKYCGKEYVTDNYNRNAENHFCCRECYMSYQREIKSSRGLNKIIPNCVCDFCGKPFHKVPSAMREHNFCSRKCQNTYLAQKERDKAQKDLNCTCAYCGKKFHRKKSHIGKIAFCGPECLDKYRKERKVHKKCIVCGKEFTANHYNRDTAQFCSTKCQIEYQRRFYKKVKCAYCKKEIILDKTRQDTSKTGKFFCNHECASKYFSGENSPVFKGTTKVSDLLRTKYERKQRSEAFVKHGRYCVLCGELAEHLHHIYELNWIVKEYLEEHEETDLITGKGRYFAAQNIIKTSEIFNDINNLLPVCKGCHRRIHSRKGEYMKITNIDYSMSENSYSIYFSGCRANPKCEDCFNPENWDFSMGEPWLNYTKRISDDIKTYSTLINKIILVGGEPLDQEHHQLEQFIDFIKIFNIPIFLFTRYELNEVPQFVKDKCDFIKTGAYIPSLKTDNNIQEDIKLATSNQKINKKGVDY